jgi:hypothetical protein
MEYHHSLKQRSTIKIMMYSASMEDLKIVLEWLRGGEREHQWKDHTRLLSETIAELRHLARTMHRPEEPTSRSLESDFVPPGASQIDTAMPHLTKMLTAMNSRNRPAAIAFGEAALALLPDGP